MYKIKFSEKQNHAADLNLNWPRSGIKGTLGANETAVIALIEKTTPTQLAMSGKTEIEKLDVKLSWKLDIQKIADAEKKAEKEAEASKRGVQFNENVTTLPTTDAVTATGAQTGDSGAHAVEFDP